MFFNCIHLLREAFLLKILWYESVLLETNHNLRSHYWATVVTDINRRVFKRNGVCMKVLYGRLMV